MVPAASQATPSIPSLHGGVSKWVLLGTRGFNNEIITVILQAQETAFRGRAVAFPRRIRMLNFLRGEIKKNHFGRHKI